MTSKIKRTRWSMAAACLLAAGAVFATTSAALAQAVPQSLVGQWVVVEAERQMAPLPSLVGASVTFTADRFKVERPERSSWEGVVHLNAEKGAIDLLHEGGSLVPPIRGDKWEGIYRFNGDVLEINTSQGHDARPTEFLSGYDLVLMKLRRR